VKRDIEEAFVQSVTKGILLILAAGFGTFVVAFLAIFVPMLIHDMHVAPPDGQGGMAGGLLGIAIAPIAALIATLLTYRWVAKQGRFTPSDTSRRS
jgi:hypothetical protein